MDNPKTLSAHDIRIMTRKIVNTDVIDTAKFILKKLGFKKLV